jgi:hypothetical protein
MLLLRGLLLPDAPVPAPALIPAFMPAGGLGIGRLACDGVVLLSCAVKAGKLNSRSTPFSLTTTVLFKISFTVTPGAISLLAVSARGGLPSTAMIATLAAELPEWTTPRNCTLAMALSGERPPNTLAAALIGGIVRTLLGGADTARGSGPVHCTIQYASVADKARNSTKEAMTGKRFISGCIIMTRSFNVPTD